MLPDLAMIRHFAGYERAFAVLGFNQSVEARRRIFSRGVIEHAALAAVRKNLRYFIRTDDSAASRGVA